MAPVVQTTATSTTTGLTSHVCTLPAGVVAGDLLYLDFVGGGLTSAAQITTPVGWTDLAGNAFGNNARKLWWRIATGSEGASVTITTSIAADGRAIAYRISGATRAVVSIVKTEAATLTPQSRRLAPILAADPLWLSTVSSDVGTGFSTQPAGYSNVVVAGSTPRLLGSERANNVVSEAPGAYTWVNPDNRMSYTIAFYTPAPTVVAGAAANDVGGTNTSHPITLPSGIAAGDLLVLAFVGRTLTTAAQISDPAGWTQLTGSATTVSATKIWTRTATGSEGASVTITTSAGCQGVGLVYRSHGPTSAQSSAPSTGSSTAPDSGSLSATSPLAPSAYLSIAAGEDMAVPSAYPAGWTDVGSIGHSAAGGPFLAAAALASFVTTADPGAFTLDASSQWLAWTIALGASGNCFPGEPGGGVW